MCYENPKKLNTQIERYFVIKIGTSLKMQKIIKQRSPSCQFAFIKTFNFLVKIAIFRAFLLFWEIRIMLLAVIKHCMIQISQKKKKYTLRIFIKAKLTVSKSCLCLLGLLCFMIICILRDVHISIAKYLSI